MGLGEGYVLAEVQEGTVGSDKIAVWHVIYDKPDGTKHQHTIPKVAVNWRMAEYELENVDEAIDWVLYEPWAVDPNADRQPRPDPAMRAGLMKVTPLGEPDEPVTLFTADTIDDAREAQRIRIQEAKERAAVVIPEPQGDARSKAVVDPVQVMRDTHTVSVEDVQEKRLRVRALRQGMGLDLDKPPAWEELVKNRPEPKLPFDPSLTARDRARRKDPVDDMYGVPMPKDLEGR